MAIDQYRTSWNGVNLRVEFPELEVLIETQIGDRPGHLYVSFHLGSHVFAYFIKNPTADQAEEAIQALTKIYDIGAECGISWLDLIRIVGSVCEEREWQILGNYSSSRYN